MHLIVSIAVIIALTVSRSVRCQSQDTIGLVTSYDLRTYYHKLDDLIGPLRNAEFLNAICQQTPGNGGIVQGAIFYAERLRDSKYMLWADYMETIGRFGYPDRNFAGGRGGWDTFKVRCGLVAARTWATNAPIQFGPWVQNELALDLKYEVPIEVKVEGFRCDSNLPFWSYLLETRSPYSDIPGLFLRRLHGLPDGIKHAWVGTQHPTTQTNKYNPEIMIQAGHQLRLATNMVERTVVAYLSIEVVEYFFSAGESISAPTWKGRRGWDRIYTSEERVQCTAVCNLLPNTWIQIHPLQQLLPPTQGG
jgi:hypothetical protein